MSERESERRALTPYPANQPAMVQVAGRQLAIAAQLNQGIERARLVAILKRISSKDATRILSQSAMLDGDLIEHFVDRWDWCYLSSAL